MLKWLEVVSFLFRVTWVFNRVVMTRLELEEAELHKEKKNKKFTCIRERVEPPTSPNSKSKTYQMNHTHY